MTKRLIVTVVFIGTTLVVAVLLSSLAESKLMQSECHTKYGQQWHYKPAGFSHTCVNSSSKEIRIL